MYSGDTNFATSTSAALTQTVNQASTGTTLASSPNPSVTGQSVTYTATVTVSSPGAGTPTGTVAFKDGGTTIAACSARAVAAGKATCPTAPSTAGPHTITAVYSGDTNFATSTSAPLTQTVAAAVAPGPPTRLAATAHDGKVGLSWLAPASNGGSAIVGYNVYVGTSAGGESAVPANAAPVAATSFTVGGLVNGTRYFFVVRAVNGVGPSLPSNEASAVPMQAHGYWLVGRDGGVFSFAGAGFHGSLGGVHLAAPIVGMAATADGGGYWLVGRDGGVFSFGDARFHGSLGATHLAAPIVGMVATADGGGYWLVGRDGGIFTFGTARFHGSLGGVPLAAPIVGMVATADGGGYLLAASDGEVFNFGDDTFHGSLLGVHVAAPIVAIVATPDGGGYWLVGADGGVFTFGSARFHGSLGGTPLAAPIVAMLTTRDGGGYRLIGGDGGIFNFGDAAFGGSLPAMGVSVTDVVGGA